MSIEPLKVEGQNGNFSIYDALLEKGFQEVENTDDMNGVLKCRPSK